MNSDDSTKDADKEENSKDAVSLDENEIIPKPESKQTSMSECVVLLEGTHTTSTDTDALSLIGVETIIPETSLNIRNELEKLNLTLLEVGMDTNAKRKNDDESPTKTVGEMIFEMNENIQAIISMFSQRKIEEEVEKFRSELHDLPQMRNDADYGEIETGVKSTSRKALGGEQPSNVGDVQISVNETENAEFSSPSVTDSCCTDMIIPLSVNQASGVVSDSVAPCESAYHTLHIHASNSPTASVMYRPPICVRLWMIINDFFTAIFECLHVNRDFIFCLGFFIAFVVSASVLTAFFYRTLSLDPQAYRNQKQQQPIERAYPKQIASKSGVFF